MVCGVFCIYPDMGGEVWCVVCSVYILILGGGVVWCVLYIS